MEQQKLIFISVERSEIEQMIEAGIDKALQRIMSQMQPQATEELLTRKQVAELFKTSLVTLRQWEKDGIIPKPIRKGSRVFFRKSEIMADISTNSRKTLI